MPVYMVERYIPALDAQGVEAQAALDRALADEAAPALRHLRTTYSREDELCFSFFDAGSRQSLVTANALGSLPYERITEVIEVSETKDGS